MMASLNCEQLKSLYFDYTIYRDNLSFEDWKKRLSVEEFYQKNEGKYHV